MFDYVFQSNLANMSNQFKSILEVRTEVNICIYLIQLYEHAQLFTVLELERLVWCLHMFCISCCHL